MAGRRAPSMFRPNFRFWLKRGWAQVRNPWGMKEWCGRWADYAPEWSNLDPDAPQWMRYHPQPPPSKVAESSFESCRIEFWVT